MNAIETYGKALSKIMDKAFTEQNAALEKAAQAMAGALAKGAWFTLSAPDTGICFRCSYYTVPADLQVFARYSMKISCCTKRRPKVPNWSGLMERRGS